MDTLRGIECFVKAVEAGSIAAAARQLGISPAAASQNIARLESLLKARLLTRTTRRLALTDSGRVYYQQVRDIIRNLELAGQAVAAINEQPQGRLCIAASAAFSRHVLAPLMPAFNRTHPLINIELISTDRQVDHVKEGIDISICIKELLQDGLIARRIATVTTKFCASPDYIARCGSPAEPEQLKDHDCLVFRLPVDGKILRWAFIRDGVRFNADVRPVMVSDDIDVLARFAASGGGITRLAPFVADPYLASGELVELFKPGSDAQVSAEIQPLHYYLCIRDRYARTPKVAAFIDFIDTHLQADGSTVASLSSRVSGV